MWFESDNYIRAIKTTKVKDAIKQAGDPDVFKKEVAYEDRKLSPADVVVGGGGSWFRKLNLAGNGKSVAPFEKPEIGGD